MCILKKSVYKIDLTKNKERGILKIGPLISREIPYSTIFLIGLLTLLQPVGCMLRFTTWYIGI